MVNISPGLFVVIFLLLVSIIYRFNALKIIEGMLNEYARKKPLVREHELTIGTKNLHYSLGFAIIIISWEQLVIEFRLFNDAFFLGFGYAKIITVLLLILLIIFSINAYLHLRKARGLIEHVEHHQKRVK